MKTNWLWDKKITDLQAKRILRDPSNMKFISLGAVLLARSNEPRKVFKNYIGSREFCRYWPAIKRKMRKDKWNEPRIIFWQAIYEKLADKYRNQGAIFKKDIPIVRDLLCEEVGKQLSAIRYSQGISQKELAAKLGVSQQLVSRIESGRENASLSTLSNLSRALGRKIRVDFVE